MVSEAKKGLAWRKEFGRGGTAVGIARARDIVSGKNLSKSTIKRMFSFFSRHEVDKKGKGFKPSGDGFPSNGRIAWALWGGDAGFSWSRKLTERFKREKKKGLSMAIPFPLAEETEQSFLDRCMSDQMMTSEFSDINQRLQVCSIQARYKSEKEKGFSRHRISFREGSEHKVDEQKGVMTELSLIQVGEAKGHDLYVDQQSLETALDVIGESLPAYITHEGALSTDRILKEVGIFSEFYIEDDKLKAKEFKALSSFKEDEKQRYNRLFDIASTMPETFGISLVFEALVVYVLKNGREVPANELDDEDQVNLVRDIPSVRFISIKSADFVDAPASNENGLFSTKIFNMTKEQKIEEEIIEEKLEQADDQVEQVDDQVEEQPSLESKLDDLEKKLAEANGKIEQLQGQLSEAETINDKLSSLIEGDDAISEEVEEQVEKVSALEKFEQAEGNEKTRIFREHKSEIYKLLNNRG